MKKYIKITAIALLTAIMCCMLCSCNELDEMKKEQAFWSDSEHKQIMYDGMKYTKLPGNITSWCSTPDGYESKHVTDSDVPVLLQTTFGDEVFTDSKNAIFEYFNDYTNVTTYYCREDLYDEVYKSLQDKKLDFYLADMCEYNSETDDCAFHIKILSDEQTAAINDIISNQKPVIKTNVYNDIYVYIQPCDKNGLFTNSIVDEYIYLTKYEDKYYIDVETYIFDSSVTDEGVSHYKVPDKYKSVLGELYEEYSKAYKKIFADTAYEE